MLGYACVRGCDLSGVLPLESPLDYVVDLGQRPWPNLPATIWRLWYLLGHFNVYSNVLLFYRSKSPRTFVKYSSTVLCVILQRYIALGILWPMQTAASVAIIVTLVSQAEKVNRTFSNIYFPFCSCTFIHHPPMWDHECVHACRNRLCSIPTFNSSEHDSTTINTFPRPARRLEACYLWACGIGEAIFSQIGECVYFILQVCPHLFSSVIIIHLKGPQQVVWKDHQVNI